MRIKQLFILAASALVLFACGKKKEPQTMSNIPQETIEQVVGELQSPVAERSVPQVAALWREEDGSAEDFKTFCLTYFAPDSASRATLARTLQQNFESLQGCYNKMSVDLKLNVHVDGPEITPVDEIFAAYDPAAHWDDDMYQSKLAFITILNFPAYSLEEKNELGARWSRQEWAYARLGDMFTSRVPAQININIAEALSNADNYISNYNIFMHSLVDNNGQRLFPESTGALITHWGLRDELKSDYADAEHGLEKQEMIYQVMQRIIDQSIPQCVINSGEYAWNPYSNEVLGGDGASPVCTEREADVRYQHLLNCFHAMQAADRYNPTLPTAIQRSFEGEMEVSDEEIEQMFISFISSPQVKEVAELIKARLGRELRPFDIWYDGFKARSAISEEELTAMTQKRYPNADAVQADLPRILRQMGFEPAMAQNIVSCVKVDPSRGAGHAWEAAMKGDRARLRTRIGPNGMDYKGYNICVHEFGHNVEQTLTLYAVDHWALRGVPNTGFTEALAFVFQTRDLDLLGLQNNDPNIDALNTLDIFWGCYEIMGVSLVDLRVWRWMYDHPEAKPAELKEAVMAIAREVWNQYYAPLLGEQDSPILAVYSHMIDSPLYLSNYPYGHIIQFQLEQQLRGRNIANEILRIFPVGRLTPLHWMRHAVGSEVSAQPLLDATQEAVGILARP